jgi:hypothetical protein
MAIAKIRMHEVDIPTFQGSIFMSGADMFAPVAIAENRIHYLREAFELQTEHPRTWVSYAGPAGVGQYSLKNGPAGVLARHDIHFRIPMPDEMECDFDHFGEQVLGPAVDEVPEAERGKWKHNGIFKFFGEPHYYMGPPRIEKTLFLTRVFPGELPNSLEPLLDEINEVKVEEPVVTQAYQFLHASGGTMKYAAFENPANYDSSKLTSFGSVKMLKARVPIEGDERLVFYPKNDRSHPIDFSGAIVRA